MIRYVNMLRICVPAVIISSLRRLSTGIWLLVVLKTIANDHFNESVEL